MNVILMAAKKDRRCVETPASKPERTDGAFDLWLQRGLHQLFDDVASEPVPEELLRLIQDDRDRQ